MQGAILVEGQDALKQIQAQWQAQKRWGFALDITQGHMGSTALLQLPSLPGTEPGKSQASYKSNNGTKVLSNSFRNATSAPSTRQPSSPSPDVSVVCLLGTTWHVSYPTLSCTYK